MSTFSYFQWCAFENHWIALAPEILLSLVGLFLLAIQCCSCKPQLMSRWLVCGTFWVLLFGVGYHAYGMPPEGRRLLFSGLILQTPYTDIFRLFFLLSGLLTVGLAHRYFKNMSDLCGGAFYPLVLFTTAGFMVLVQTHHFAAFFVLLEVVTVGFYILIAYNKSALPSLEAAFKYLILGALSSGILLMGIALLYGTAGRPDLPACVVDGMAFSALQIFIEANATHPFVLIAVAFILIGLAFKIGAFPFQIWIPDVYQGAPMPVTALLAVASKASGIILLMNLLHGPFSALKTFFIPLLIGIAIITILFGNLGALGQTFTKRILGFSGIAHAGYLLLGVAASFYVSWAPQIILLYLVIYLIANYAMFYVMSLMPHKDFGQQRVQDFMYLAQKDSYLGFCLMVALGSLAGIPPLAGFVSKFLLLIAVYQSGFYWAFGAALLGVVISVYYYFNWMRVASFSPFSVSEGVEQVALPLNLETAERMVLSGLTLLSIILGMVPLVIAFI